MPRQWRCANGHAWTGDLGALTYCPDCGSADVYEVRPQYESSPNVSAGAPPKAGQQTFIQPAGGPRAGDTLIQPLLAQPSVHVPDTLVQIPALPADVGGTEIHPALVSDGTMVQPVATDSSTTAHQVYVPSGDDATMVQAPIAEGGTLIQEPPAKKDESTLDMPAFGAVPATLDQPTAGGSAADGPTLLAPSANPPPAAETRVYRASPADAGSVLPHPADAPTLDGSGPDGPSNRTADYPSTISLSGPPKAPGAGISNQDTREAPPPPSARGKGGRPPATPSMDGYEILGVLGRGGMGVVYKARHTKLNRIVALKMILAGGHAGAYERQRFLTESQAVAQLQHPNIVQIYETGERDGLPYFSLEFCDGGSLQQKLGGQPLPPKMAADIAEQLARAMQYAHEKGIVHRDLKPANILFAGSEAAIGKEKPSPSKDSKVNTKDAKSTAKDLKVSGDTGRSVGVSRTSQSKTGQSFQSSRSTASTASMRASRVTPKVTDFGLAKRFEEDSGLTGSGTILGTPSYMAPEQAEGNTKSVGPPADIHALGAVLYEMLTGRPPFLGENVVETMNQVRTMDPVPPTRIQPKTPLDLETVCLKCLQKEMHKRYASAGDLADDLHRFQHGEPIAARPVPVWEKGWKWAKRRPAQAALIALSMAVLIGAVVGSLEFGTYEREKARYEEGLKNDAIEAREKAVQQKQIAVTEFKRAEANFNSAREAVDNLLVRVGSERLEHVPKAEKLRRELLEQSLKFYDRFLTEHAENPAVRREAGWAYQRVGRIRNDLGDRKAAIAGYEEAVTLFTPLAAEPGDRQTDDRLDLAQTQRQLAVVLEADGKPAQADAAYEAARPDCGSWPTRMWTNRLTAHNWPTYCSIVAASSIIAAG